MHVWLMRHGPAFDRADPACPPDPDRPLTDRGRARTARAVRGLGALDVAPDVILTSPYVRAHETAELVADGLGLDRRIIRGTAVLEPDRAPRELMKELHDLEGRPVLCCGHLPHLSFFASEAIGARGEALCFKKCATAYLDFLMGLDANAQLVWHLSPRALRALGSGTDAKKARDR